MNEGGGRAPRVLVSGVVLSQPMGGVRRHNAELLPRVAELLDSDGGGLAVLEGKEGIPFDLSAPIERIPSDVPAHPILVRAAREGRAIARAMKAADAAGEPFDLVHFGHLPVPRRLDVPFTITLHDLRSLDLGGAPFARRFFAKRVVGAALRRAARVFTVSETMRTRLREGWGLAEDAVHVVPNAGDHLEPLERAPQPDAPILHVGHVEPRKNLELLVRALAEDPELPPLLIAGRAVGNEVEWLTELAEMLEVEGRVTFSGPFEDDDLPGLLASAACVVLPSRLEGFGIVALEAQRARVPLAVSEAGALPEVAGAGVPTFDTNEPRECAQAIRAALAMDWVEIERCASRADGYRWDDSAARWVDGWRSLFYGS